MALVVKLLLVVCLIAGAFCVVRMDPIAQEHLIDHVFQTLLQE